MNLDPSYISGVPEHTSEVDVTKRHGAGRGKVVKNYYLGRSYIGQRVYDKDGLLEHEYHLNNSGEFPKNANVLISVHGGICTLSPELLR
jgi:hypothetical protein